MTMMSNPWFGITPVASHMAGRRADPDHPRDWWWCVDPDGTPALVLYAVSARELPNDLVDLKGLSASFRKQADGVHFLLLLMATGGDVELFHTLCLDLVECTQKCASPDSAVDVVLARLRRWQQLLRKGKKPGLTDEEVRGMLAELLFLRDELRPKYGIEAAIRGWSGPAGHPQDFAVDECAFEIKSRLSAARQVIEISSLDQLESKVSSLVLVVQDLTVGQAESPGGTTLAQLVKQLRALAASVGQELVDQFDSSVDSVGYEDGRRYADVWYIDAGRRYFRVGEDFPRIIRSGTQSEIVRARYSLDITQCGRFKVSEPWV